VRTTTVSGRGLGALFLPATWLDLLLFCRPCCTPCLHVRLWQVKTEERKRNVVASTRSPGWTVDGKAGFLLEECRELGLVIYILRDRLCMYVNEFWFDVLVLNSLGRWYLALTDLFGCTVPEHVPWGAHGWHGRQATVICWWGRDSRERWAPPEVCFVSISIRHWRWAKGQVVCTRTQATDWHKTYMTPSSNYLQVQDGDYDAQC
jgi:hypothetical protein